MEQQAIWNFGDMLDALGDNFGPDHPALVQGDRTISWPAMTRRSNNLARSFFELGAEAGDKVGFYLHNRPEYMEGLAACWKARLTHVNVNYRYIDDELIYILDNSDSTLIIYGEEFREAVARIRSRLPKVKAWIEVGSDEGRPDSVHDYDVLAGTGDGEKLDIKRSGEDMLFLYTGGTTGMPKGVMWTHQIWRDANQAGLETIFGFVPTSMDDYVAAATEHGMSTRQCPACPLMHGTGLFTAMGALLNGGTVAVLPSPAKFDAEELWHEVDRLKLTNLAIVGDAFAKPMLNALNDAAGLYDLSSVRSIVSSGVMWSVEVKQGLLEHLPQAALMDSFGASESVGFGMSVMTADGEVQTGRFAIGPHCKVFSEDGREIEPGGGEPGFIARGGAVPLGYYKDEAKTAKTFKTINGVRYAIPGDWCTVEADGTLTLMGRGSICINSGGEKIYPEEIEEALKTHPQVRDALVVGVPDDKWGQAVTAVVSPEPGVVPAETDLIDHVKAALARYKAPKRVLFRDDLARAPNGKADYAGTKSFAMEQLGLS
ncbi:MAG: acyl-CoA synthetase [Pseudomonadota bacterium]